ncbi:MAG: KH domain-containing protein [Armatimonadetes bacterium]|nr:KH domain-containing protein [Armatimonadota bacterium]NIO76146.1 KH domain-containing protein [Armatimonadota bacterium]NIO98842.1 KH domain-containing protein [Armatimonadota bacterium]
MQELIEMIVKALVDSPDEVRIKKVEGERSIIFEVRVPQEDLGKVIGKQGRIANSIRTLVRAAGTKQRKSIWVAINSTDDAEQEE